MPIPVNIGASRGAAILGLSKWTTPVQVWLQIMEAREPGFCIKNGFEYQPFEGNASTRWGSAFESAIIDLAEQASGDNIIDREKYFCAADYITCHIDGAYEEPIPRDLHEGKTTTIMSYRDEWGDPGTDRVPIEYQIQAQHQMLCTGSERVIISVLVFPKRPDEFEEMGWIFQQDDSGEYFAELGEQRLTPVAWANILNQMGYFHQYIINKNEILQRKMLNSYRDWWSKHVIGNTPPEPQSYDDIKALCREPHGTIIAPEEIERLVSEYKNIGEEISASGPLAKRREQVKVEILNYMRSAGFADDDESHDKWILRGQDGRKLASYGKNKNGIFMFR